MNVFVKSQQPNENKNDEFEMKLDIYFYENNKATRYLTLKEIKEKVVKSIIDSKHNTNYSEIKKHLEDVILYYMDEEDRIYLDKGIDLEVLIQYYMSLPDPSLFVLIAEVNFDNFPNQAKNNVILINSNNNHNNNISNNNNNNSINIKKSELDEINSKKNELLEVLNREKEMRLKKKYEKENLEKNSNQIIVNQNDSINFEDKNVFSTLNNTEFDLNEKVKEIILKEIDLESLASKLCMEITNNMSVYMNNPTNSNKLIHKGFKCSNCKNGKDIEGIRYTCIICKVPFNLCEKCENDQTSPHEHPLAKFKYRLDQKKINEQVSKQFQFKKFEESMINIENKEEKPFELANFDNNNIEESVILMENFMK